VHKKLKRLFHMINELRKIFFIMTAVFYPNPNGGYLTVSAPNFH
jgi:hypothetical protein